jgi:hypothetical protein
MKNHRPSNRLALAVGCVLCGVWSAFAAPDPLTVFRHPPTSAKTGVWWHWMGCNVTREGIVKDLDWFQEMGIGAATIFGMADVCTPWATHIGNSPTAGLLAFTPDWWRLVRFACEEAEKRGIELGLHNCPGYTSTGGPWIPPHLSMRELVFNVTNAQTQISLKANAAFPVEIGTTGKFERPDIPARRSDLREIAVVDGVRVQHIPMGSFTQPNQWEMFGLECDKMNPEAVAFHLDYIIGEMKKYLGDQIGRGLKFVLLDSYEAGRPTWTPRMREEFKARRGYDPLPFLPLLGGFKVAAAPDAASVNKFKSDYNQTIRELYRDVLFKIMHEKLAGVGLEFACEPYGGPFDSRECAAHIDRLMTEFWYGPSLNRRPAHPMNWNRWTGPGGRRHNIVEAEAFTSGPPACNWTETPFFLKAAADTQFDRGINRMTLHTCPLQPWGDEIKPGKTMGRWGTHFGRNQTWAKSGKGWFTYLNRCQALLQWGEPSDARIIGRNITPARSPVTARARAADGRLVFFVVNHTDHGVELDAALPQTSFAPEWFDPVTGSVRPLALSARGVHLRLPPCGSGFLVLRRPAAGEAQPSNWLPSHPVALLDAPWRVTFGDVSATFPALADWTVQTDPRIRYFSGTATYETTMIVADASADVLSLGNCNRQVARVVLNGRDLGCVWCEPYEVALPPGVLKTGANRLVIEFTNVWANRLIGDEQHAPDCEYVKAPYPGGWYLKRFPDWFAKGLSARPSKGRVCFSDWKYFTASSKLVPSGLLGPVVLKSTRGAR